MIRIGDEDLPALFRAADDLSRSSQKSYLLMMSLNIILIILASVLGAISLATVSAKSNISLISSIIIGTSIVVTYITDAQKLDKDWYDGRAVAESVKTKAWRFMMRSDPYANENAATLFSNTIRGIREERRSFVAKLNASSASGNQITEKMESVRELDLEQRRALYLQERIENQRNWYSSKAELNRLSAKKWFRLMLGCQIAALVMSFASVRWFNLSVNTVSIFTTCASSALAWLQLKRHQELSNSYSLAAQELSTIAEQGRSVNTETGFALFVSDAENAISREHTLWSARRDSY